MASPVIVEMILKGMPDISRAIRSVEQSAAAADRNRERTAAQASKQRTRVEESEAKAKIRAMMQADRFQRQAQDRATRETERNARSRLRAVESEAKAESRAAERASNEKLRISRQVDREISGMEKRRARENERMLREGARLEERTHREQTKMLQERDRARQRFAKGTADRFMSAGKTGLQQASGLAGKAAGTLAQLGGGFSIADSVKEMGELEKSAVRFSNAAFMGKGERIDAGQLQAEAKAASISTGIGPNELMAGAHAFLAKTGKADEARSNMKLFGDIATGTGANIEDVAKAAGTLRVQNSDLDPAAMKSILLQTVRQGQKGSIEFSDLAGSVGKITRTSSGYAGNQAKTQAELLGIAQLGMATMSDPRDVATSLAGIESDTKKNWKDINVGLGGDKFDSMGRIKTGPSEFVADVMEKTNGDTRKLQDLGFGKQAMKYFQALAPEFQKAGGGKAGREALITKMKDAVAEPMGEGELQTNVTKVLNTSAMQFETAMMQLKIAVGEQLLPEFLKLVPVLKEALPTIKNLLDAFVGLANWAANNPLSGLGALMGAAFAKELAVAGISKLIQTAFASNSGIAMSTATIAIAAAAITVQKIAEAQVGEQRGSIAGSTAGVSAASGVRAGDATTQDQLAKLTGQRDAMAKQVAAEKAGVNKMEGIEYVGRAGQLSAMALGPLGIAAQKAAGISGNDTAEAGEQYQKAREERLRQSEEGLKKLNDAIRITTENLTKMGTAANGAGAPPVAKPPAASTGIVQRTQ